MYISNKKQTILGIVLSLALLFTTVFQAFAPVKKVTAASETSLLSGSDYRVTRTDKSGSESELKFVPSTAASYVIIHYTVNQGTQQNLVMSQSNGAWYYTIKNLSKGNKIECFFTYEKGGLQYDTPYASYTFGTSTSGNTSTNGVTMYTDANYGGTAVTFANGSYNMSDMLAAGIPNDSISSLKVPSGYQVTVYADINFAGSSKTFTADTNYVGADWNDKVTSFVVAPKSGDNQGGNNQGGSNPSTSIPQLRTDIPARSDRMFFQMNNRTNGAYSDQQIYWCILGINPATNKLCYVNKNGDLVPATASLNTISKNGRMCADICYTLAEANYVYMPNITSGRMYISYGSQVYITINQDINGNTGYAGPDLNNTSDPNLNVFFEFIEFTISNKVYWGNTTRVDFFSFPVVTRLVGQNGFINTPGDANTYDKTVGDVGTRQELFNAFSKEVPNEFKSLVVDQYRIIAPCKGSFNEGRANGNYLQSAIDAFWNKYSSQDFVFTCDAGTFRGRVSGNALHFTKDGGGSGTIYKPNTQEVLEGKGVLAAGSDLEKVVEAQLCAALNRGIACSPESWGNPNAYYKSSPANYYSWFWHQHSVDALAYGFCYDDVFDNSTLLHYSNPTALVIDCKW